LNISTFKTPLLFSVISLTLIACGSGNSSDDDAKILSTTSNAITNTTWAHCGAGIKFRYRFQGSQYAYTLQYFDDADCLTPNDDPELGVESEFFSGEPYTPENITWTGTFDLGQDTITTGGGLEATEINFYYSGITKYDIAYIQNNTLYFGINGGVFVEAQRENELDFDDEWLNEGVCCQK
jgi:hypothetical protein